MDKGNRLVRLRGRVRVVRHVYCTETDFGGDVGVQNAVTAIDLPSNNIKRRDSCRPLGLRTSLTSMGLRA